MNAVRAIVFDFNGTLSDDEPVLCEIFIEMFAERGRPLSAQEYYDQLAGLSDPEIVLTWLGRDYPDVDGAVDERVQRYRDAVADGSTVHDARARGRRLRSRARAARDLLRRGARRDRAGRRVRRARAAPARHRLLRRRHRRQAASGGLSEGARAASAALDAGEVLGDRRHRGGRRVREGRRARSPSRRPARSTRTGSPRPTS